MVVQDHEGDQDAQEPKEPRDHQEDLSGQVPEFQDFPEIWVHPDMVDFQDNLAVTALPVTQESREMPDTTEHPDFPEIPEMPYREGEHTQHQEDAEIVVMEDTQDEMLFRESKEDTSPPGLVHQETRAQWDLQDSQDAPQLGLDALEPLVQWVDREHAETLDSEVHQVCQELLETVD